MLTSILLKAPLAGFFFFKQVSKVCYDKRMHESQYMSIADINTRAAREARERRAAQDAQMTFYDLL